jgi:hypothetical protein
VWLDDDVLKTAHECTGIADRDELIREALKALIAREAGRRLVALAGTAPNLEKVRRTRVGKSNDLSADQSRPGTSAD